MDRNILIKIKSIINNSNKTIKGKTIRVNYIINRQ